jgi:hypothetical protein
VVVSPANLRGVEEGDRDSPSARTTSLSRLAVSLRPLSDSTHEL